MEDEDLNVLFGEFAATYDDTNDFSKALEYFPELKDYDNQALGDFIETYKDTNDVEKALSYFPEFSKKDNTKDVNTVEEVKQPGTVEEKEKPLEFDKNIFEERELFTNADAAMEAEKNGNYFKDALSGFAQTTIDLFGVGPRNFEKMLKMQALEVALNMHDSNLNKEQKRSLLVAGEKAFDITDTGKEVLEDVSEDLQEKQIKYETESFLDDIENGDYAQASKRALSSAFKSVPTLIAAYSGIGGIVGIGLGSAGNKFDEEFEKEPEKSRYYLWPTRRRVS